MRAGRFRELRAKPELNRHAEASLPYMNPLEQRALMGRRLRPSPELVGVLELLKKLERIFDTVDPEFERVDGPATDRDGGLGVRAEGLARGQREIGLGLGVAEAGGRGGRQNGQMPG